MFPTQPGPLRPRLHPPFGLRHLDKNADGVHTSSGPGASWGNGGQLSTSAVTRNSDYPEWMLGNDAVDNAMMWAAHELRGPLHAARAALDHIAELSDQGEVEPELVRRTRDQL